MKEKFYTLILDFEIKKGRDIYVGQFNSNERTGLAWFIVELWKLSTVKGEMQKERDDT
jgi:hypothetical protein